MILLVSGGTRVPFSTQVSHGFSGAKHSHIAESIAAAIAKAKIHLGIPVWRDAHWSQSEPGMDEDFSFSPRYSDETP